jgi:hypothetical protein
MNKEKNRISPPNGEHSKEESEIEEPEDSV